MSELITYDFQKGPLDDFIGQLIGASRAAREEKVVRAILLSTVDSPARNSVFLLHNNEFFFQQDGVAYRAFLYLKRSKVDLYGLPKRHYFQCDKVREGLPYVFANQDLVSVSCSEKYTFYSNVQLDVCGYCQSIFREKTSQSLYGKSFEDFILDMEESDTTRTTEIRPDGYLVNWTEISTAFRKTRAFTCEQCNLQITKPEHQHWMHVHHRNRDKRDNRRANLACLCIRCHSQVDDLHRRNFAEPHQQRELKEFARHYPR